MQTLLLASSGKFVTERASEFLPIPLSRLRIAWVTTAGKSVPRIAYLEEQRERMKELNWDVEEVDIDGKNSDELLSLFENKDVVYVEGGNSFYLLKSIRESGFESVMRELLEKGVIYIGASAGSYVACPTIEMALWKHQDKYDHHGVVDFTGMNFVPFVITAHYLPEYESLISEKIPSASRPVRILTDKQAFLVRDGEVEFIGTGEEVRLK